MTPYCGLTTHRGQKIGANSQKGKGIHVHHYSGELEEALNECTVSARTSAALDLVFFPEAQVSCVSTSLGLSACGRLRQAVEAAEAAAGCSRLRQAAAGCGRLRQAAAGCGILGILGRFWTFLPIFFSETGGASRKMFVLWARYCKVLTQKSEISRQKW